MLFEALFSKLAMHWIANSAFRKKNFVQENFCNFLQFAKFVKIISIQNFVLYSNKSCLNYSILTGTKYSYINT